MVPNLHNGPCKEEKNDSLPSWGYGQLWESPTAAACHWASSSLTLQFQVPALDGSKTRPVSWEEGGKPQAQEIWKRLTTPPSPHGQRA